MAKFGRMEINKVVSYIGVDGGYLGDFSYRTHEEFYPNYCNLDINPYEYYGTTRERFIAILTEATASNQARIIQGIIEKYPLSYFEEQIENEYKTFTEKNYNEKEKLRHTLTQYVTRLKGEVMEHDDLKHDFEFVNEVLEQANTLIANHSYGSAVDRTHTALHAYLTDLCKEASIIFDSKTTKIQDMWARMKIDHPSFQINMKDHQKPINQTVTAISKFLENLNDIRNNHGFSHPNEEIIDEHEARFIINLSRVLLMYLDSKTQP
jgi:hypothetical protein